MINGQLKLNIQGGKRQWVAENLTSLTNMISVDEPNLFRFTSMYTETTFIDLLQKRLGDDDKVLIRLVGHQPDESTESWRSSLIELQANDRLQFSHELYLADPNKQTPLSEEHSRSIRRSNNVLNAQGIDLSTSAEELAKYYTTDEPTMQAVLSDFPEVEA